jgi:hypothetical protein
VNNSIGDQGGQEIYEALKINKTIKIIHLRMTLNQVKFVIR